MCNPSERRRNMFILVDWKACYGDYVMNKKTGQILYVDRVQDDGVIVHEGHYPFNYRYWKLQEYYVLFKIHSLLTPLEDIPEIKKVLALRDTRELPF
jgi:hypothetical protein